MAIDRFYIGYLDNNSGLQTDVKPFAIADNAFQSLTNAYVYRGRVRKRFGSKLMNSSVDSDIAQLHSRLRIKIGTTDANGNLPATNISALIPGATGANGQIFSISGMTLGVPTTTIFTSYLAGGIVMLTTGAATATYDIATTVVTITGNNENPLADVYWYPGLPVMGLIPYENTRINEEPVIAFDTRYSYQYTGGGWERFGTASWTGSDSQFFWGCNYRGILDTSFALFVVNYNGPDLIKWWDSAGAVWVNLNPVVYTGTTLRSARLIAWFHNRLLFFNTIEQTGANPDQVFQNRVRFSILGWDPTYANGFRQDIRGNGGFLDSSTKEAIVSCGFIKDRLIVYFERSTWELVYTGNDVDPFTFQKLNVELGVESTFSAVPFDKVLLGMGNVGLHACNGVNVARIDQKIPNNVFQISNENEGTYRVYGIRDYPNQMVYWAFPDEYSGSKYPNRVLVYNYMTGSWALNEDSITCFGYFQPSAGTTWASCGQTWEESIGAWNSGAFNAQYREIIAGNQEGFVFIIDPDVPLNAPALQVTAIQYVAGLNLIIFTAYNHNLETGSYVKLTHCENVNGVNDKIFEVLVIDENNFSVPEDPDDPFGGVYQGAGTVARVSNINILTKQFNFYVDQGRNAFITKVDFHVDRTSEGEVTVDCFDGSSWASSLTLGAATQALLGNGKLETFPYVLANLERFQTRLWHPLFFQVDGECIQFRIFMNTEQITSPFIAESDFQLNAMVIHATPTASRLQ